MGGRPGSHVSLSPSRPPLPLTLPLLYHAEREGGPRQRGGRAVGGGPPPHVSRLGPPPH